MKFAYLIEPPFNYVDEDGRVTGCDVELARYVVRARGLADLEPVGTEFAALLPGLVDGRWSMTTGLFATEERRKSAAFSRPIWALPDGLLVRAGNPKGVTGYRSLAENKSLRLAVIRDQFQHRSAITFGMDEDRISVFATYAEAAEAVRRGTVDAYASVARAHTGFIGQMADRAFDVVVVPQGEKPAAFGSFAFRLDDVALLHDVNDILAGFLGTDAHRTMVAAFGFTSAEVDLVAG